MLRRICGPNRREIVGRWGKLHTEEFHDLDVSPNINGVIKSSRMRQAGHVICLDDVKN